VIVSGIIELLIAKVTGTVFLKIYPPFANALSYWKGVIFQLEGLLIHLLAHMQSVPILHPLFEETDINKPLLLLLARRSENLLGE